jgi:hypothetical protein
MRFLAPEAEAGCTNLAGHEEECPSSAVQIFAQLSAVGFRDGGPPRQMAFRGELERSRRDGAIFDKHCAYANCISHLMALGLRLELAVV